MLGLLSKHSSRLAVDVGVIGIDALQMLPSRVELVAENLHLLYGTVAVVGFRSNSIKFCACLFMRACKATDVLDGYSQSLC